jgi:hypothetical protein
MSHNFGLYSGHFNFLWQCSRSYYHLLENVDFFFKQSWLNFDCQEVVPSILVVQILFFFSMSLSCYVGQLSSCPTQRTMWDLSHNLYYCSVCKAFAMVWWSCYTHSRSEVTPEVMPLHTQNLEIHFPAVPTLSPFPHSPVPSGFFSWYF